MENYAISIFKPMTKKKSDKKTKKSLSIVGGNITVTDRARRLAKIQELLDEGYTHNQIAIETGISLSTVERNIKYLKELGKGSISPKELSKKRVELYSKLIRTESDALEMFELYKNPTKCPLCEGKGYTEIKVAKPVVEEGEEEFEISKVVCDNCKGMGYIHYANNANKFLHTINETIEKMMKLYGLDGSSNNAVQFNQQINISDDEKISISSESRDKIADLLVEGHEKVKRDEFNIDDIEED